ncbi:MAG: hypothetical protein B7Z81_01335, partial [Acidocella sp. 20-61-6]
MTEQLTISGGTSSTTLIPVPSNAPSVVNTLIQSYLNALQSSVSGGSIGIQNYNINTGQNYTTSGSSSGTFLEVTNTDSAGNVSNSATTGSFSVPVNTVGLVVQAPGTFSVTGSASTTTAIFGANSNVNYSVNNGQGTIVASGGANNINATGVNSNVSVASAGNDTVTFNGTSGADTVAAAGNATTAVFVGGSNNATVVASDSAQAHVVFLQNSGGNLNFVNQSGAAQTVYSGSYTLPGGGTAFAPNSITVDGGTGGGFYVGGRAGNNSLTGGAGVVTLQGGGTGDVLVANASTGSANQLFGGTGLETLIGSSTSGSNVFQLGLLNVGIGDVTASGVASTDGSGTQSFILGNTNGETLTGSSAAGAFNIYSVVGDSTTGGGNFTITDFNPSNSALFLENSALNGAGDASIQAIGSNLAGSAQVLLSDGTTITFNGI